MRVHGIVGIHRHRRTTLRHSHDTESAADLVNRCFGVDGPDRLWVTDITEHPPGPAGSMWPSCLMPGPAGSSDGPSLTTYTQGWSLTHSRWRYGGADQTRDRRSDRATTAPNTRRERSSGASEQLARRDQWEQQAARTTTPWPSRCSRRCNVNYLNNTNGRTAANSPWHCSNGSKPGTTPSANTPESTTTAPSTTKQSTPPPRLRHDQHNNPV